MISLEHLSNEEKLREPEFFSMERRWHWEDQKAAFPYP